MNWTNWRTRRRRGYWRGTEGKMANDAWKKLLKTYQFLKNITKAGNVCTGF